MNQNVDGNKQLFTTIPASQFETTTKSLTPVAQFNVRGLQKWRDFEKKAILGGMGPALF